MQDSAKQQNTFTTIAAANVEVIASYRVCIMNGSSIKSNSSLWVRVATTSS